jgi:hypothetical protein
MKFVYKSIGWSEINEVFIRTGVETKYGNLYFHKMKAPIKHDHYHDHPWNFWALVLWNGYEECRPGETNIWRGIGSFYKASAEMAHKTTTYDKTSYSVIITGPKIREWNGNL